MAREHVDRDTTYWHRRYVDVDDVLLLAALVVEVLVRYGPKKFVALVTDNARNMVNMRRAVLENFPHLIECR